MSTWTEKDREHLELVNDVKKRTKLVDESDPDYFIIAEDSSGLPFYIEPEPVRARAKSKRKIIGVRPRKKKHEEPTILGQINKKRRKKRDLEVTAQ